MAVFGFAGALWLALACLVVAGAMDSVSGLFHSTMWNETIPEHLRGRLAGIEMRSPADAVPPPAHGPPARAALIRSAGARATVFDDSDAPKVACRR